MLHIPLQRFLRYTDGKFWLVTTCPGKDVSDTCNLAHFACTVRLTFEKSFSGASDSAPLSQCSSSGASELSSARPFQMDPILEQWLGLIPLFLSRTYRKCLSWMSHTEHHTCIKSFVSSFSFEACALVLQTGARTNADARVLLLIQMS